MKVFLGGTCNESQWREHLKPLLAIDYFDPVVPDWNEEAYQRELREREKADVVLYTITPRMAGVYSIAEVVDDSNKRPQRTILCVLDQDGRKRWTEGQHRSIRAVERMAMNNGAIVFHALTDVAHYLNSQAIRPVDPA